jgi:hypothetical protein
MKTLMIYPSFPDTFWSFKHALKFIHKKAAHPPLGLLTVGAMLPDQWPKRLIDMNVTKLSEKDLSWADIAFVSAMAVQRESVSKTIDRCKEAGLTVVAGGPLFTGEYEHINGVDHFVLNEAELTLPSFLKDLIGGCPGHIYETSEFADIKKTPAPMWDLINLKHYASMSIQFSRGCPFNCDFCNVTALLGHRPRIKTASQIIAELDVLYSLGWRGAIFFVDDNFIGNRKYLMTALLPALIEWKKGKDRISFNTEASVNLADNPSLMQMMVEAGFDSVFIGIETPDEAGLAECNKKQNKNRDLVESVRRIQQSPSIFQRQIDFIQKSGIVTAMVGLLQAPAGTKLYQRMKNEGRLAGFCSSNDDGTTNIIPRMELKALCDGYKKILCHIYAPNHYYERIKTFLQEYQSAKIKIPLDFQRCMAFLRSFIRLGIYGVFALIYPSRYIRQGTVPILETVVVDYSQTPGVAAIGRNPCNLWPPFS